MPNYTDKLKLEKPLQNENYNIDVFNANADKIDSAVKDLTNVYNELNNKYSELYLEVNGQRLRGINIVNSLIDKIEG